MHKVLIPSLRLAQNRPQDRMKL